MRRALGFPGGTRLLIILDQKSRRESGPVDKDSKVAAHTLGCFASAQPPTPRLWQLKHFFPAQKNPAAMPAEKRSRSKTETFEAFRLLILPSPILIHRLKIISIAGLPLRAWSSTARHAAVTRIFTRGRCVHDECNQTYPRYCMRSRRTLATGWTGEMDRGSRALPRPVFVNRVGRSYFGRSVTTPEDFGLAWTPFTSGTFDWSPVNHGFGLERETSCTGSS